MNWNVSGSSLNQRAEGWCLKQKTEVLSVYSLGQTPLTTECCYFSATCSNTAEFDRKPETLCRQWKETAAAAGSDLHSLHSWTDFEHVRPPAAFTCLLLVFQKKLDEPLIFQMIDVATCCDTENNLGYFMFSQRRDDERLRENGLDPVSDTEREDSTVTIKRHVYRHLCGAGGLRRHVLISPSPVWTVVVRH